MIRFEFLKEALNTRVITLVFSDWILLYFSWCPKLLHMLFIVQLRTNLTLSISSLWSIVNSHELVRSFHFRIWICNLRTWKSGVRYQVSTIASFPTVIRYFKYRQTCLRVVARHPILEVWAMCQGFKIQPIWRWCIIFIFIICNYCQGSYDSYK